MVCKYRNILHFYKVQERDQDNLYSIQFVIKEEYLRVNGPGGGTEARGKEEDVEAEGDYNQRTIICNQNKKMNYIFSRKIRYM